jgi:hypothetical protein
LVEESVEEGGAVGLVVLAGVVALAEQDGSELDAGVEVGAGLAGRFHPALEFDGASAQAVAEHAGEGFASQSGHRPGLGDVELVAVQGVDLGADGGVFVGDDAVGDAGVVRVMCIER